MRVGGAQSQVEVDTIVAADTELDKLASGVREAELVRGGAWRLHTQSWRR